MSPGFGPYCAIFALLIRGVFAQSSINILILLEPPDAPMLSLLNDVVSNIEKNERVTVNVDHSLVDRQNVDESFQAACAILHRGITLILDFTWTGWVKMRNLAETSGIMYIRGEPVINPFVRAMDDLLILKNATDCALIFGTEKELNETLYYLIGSSIIRLVVIDQFDYTTVDKVGNMRPLPTYYVIYATKKKMEEYIKTALKGGLITRDGVWNLVFTDYSYQDENFFKRNVNINVTINILTMDPKVCCKLMGAENNCDKCPDTFEIFPAYFRNVMRFLVKAAAEMIKSKGVKPITTVNCDASDTALAEDTQISANPTTSSPATTDSSEEPINFATMINLMLESNGSLFYQKNRNLLTYQAELDIQILQNGSLTKLTSWSIEKKIDKAGAEKIKAAKRYFRIGTAESVPWSIIKRDESGNPVKDKAGNLIWSGYCLDLIEMLAEKMDFDYDLVIPKVGTFGEKVNGQWNGLVGDLASGETDIVVASITMTSDREEVIDFVAPYFDQSGITIAIRKPVRETSLFKFMRVLKPEVWLSIVGALTLTGFMIWVLDKYSPYSARNNKNLYPYPCRFFIFSHAIVEKRGIAIGAICVETSDLDRGGGEAPKALSSRTLVAAYWLFVVLMLATFTANLAAFLTVERMQTPVQSLEELARQSRINYTVQNDSFVHRYFLNMKKAEDKLYEMWKEVTLNSSSDQVEFRVWDYPIKEQYGHILQAIEDTGPVSSAAEGYKKVLASEKGEFAFIHDSSEIKYEITKDCNLTEIGEVLAEQPFAIAVQQGSFLQEEISRKILDLQKDRYFETLTSKYWNNTMRRMCPNNDENQGITLESLGGVFIATLVGLILAMLTLAGEVFYYRKKTQLEKPKSLERWQIEDMEKERAMIQKLAHKLKLRPAPLVAFEDRNPKPRPPISHIAVYPRFPFQE